jgi:BirA family biotin operon repressor/biotin-[acetyl-CoA-carboxylase] ligase
MDEGLNKRYARSLSPQSIRKDLRSRWLGRQPVYGFDVVESTNREAKRLARQGAPEGTLVIAESQSKGRGRLRRLWVSPPGKGLYLSVILRPKIPPQWGPRITLTAGVALAAALQEIGITPELKWPNDVMVGHRKVAGILTEASCGKKGLFFVVVGVGVNVNTDLTDFPASIRDLATSLSLSSGKVMSRVVLLQTLLYQLEQWYERLCQGAFATILETWRQYDITLGRCVEVSLPGSSLAGVAEDLDTDGALLVRDKRGRVHRILVGDVVHCRVQARRGFQAS